MTIPAARPVPAPRQPAVTLNSAVGAGGAVKPAVDWGAGLERLGTQLADWALAPYRWLVGRIGADAFVRPGQKTAEGAPPSQWGLQYETLRFTSTDGTPLKGWYMPAAAPTGKTIVLAHGHGGSMTDTLYRWAPWLHEAGYNLLCFDFRNSGGSGGTQTTMGFEERRDLAAALSQAEAKGAREIAVVGLSMGGATALSLAADDPRIKAVVADSAFDTIENAVASRVKRNTFDLGPFKGLHFPFQDHVTRAVVEASERLTGHRPGSPGGSLRSAEPLKAAPRLQDRPVFLIHGQADDETLPGNSVNLAKAMPQADLWLVPGAKHGEAFKAKGEYRARVLDFLSRHF